MNRFFQTGLLGTALLTASVSLRSAILINETFADNERLTQDVANNSLQWTVGSHRASSAFGSLDASGGALVWDHTTNGSNSFSAVWASFAPGGSPVSMNSGETLTLSFNVSFSGGAFTTADNAFRFGLFDSNNSRVTTDFAENNTPGISSGTTFSTWRGYQGSLRINSSASASTFITRERTGTGNGLNDSANWTSFVGSNAGSSAFSTGTTYSGSLTLIRNGSTMEIVSSFNGNTTNLVVDSSGIVSTFDTISFFTVDALSHNITLDNIQVTVIPEPSTWMLLGLGLFFLTFLRSGKSLSALPARIRHSSRPKQKQG